VTKTEKAAGAKLVLDQEVRLGDRLLIAARVVVAVVNRAGRPRRLPTALVTGFIG
jgi:acyl-CoA thioester hydrolase